MAALLCFEELEIWQRARELAKGIFLLYADNEEFINFLSIAKGTKFKGRISKRETSNNIYENNQRSCYFFSTVYG